MAAPMNGCKICGAIWHVGVEHNCKDIAAPERKCPHCGKEVNQFSSATVCEDCMKLPASEPMTAEKILYHASEYIQDNLEHRFGSKYFGEEVEPPMKQALEAINQLRRQDSDNLLQLEMDYKKLQDVLRMILWQSGGSIKVSRRTQVATPFHDTELEVTEDIDGSVTYKLNQRLEEA